jgi:hypothetical protein
MAVLSSKKVKIAWEVESVFILASSEVSMPSVTASGCPLSSTRIVPLIAVRAVL